MSPHCRIDSSSPIDPSRPSHPLFTPVHATSRSTGLHTPGETLRQSRKGYCSSGHRALAMGIVATLA
eukprot:9266788-Heterocapsa_arctica.AAC.1